MFVVINCTDFCGLYSTLEKANQAVIGRADIYKCTVDGDFVCLKSKISKWKVVIHREDDKTSVLVVDNIEDVKEYLKIWITAKYPANVELGWTTPTTAVLYSLTSEGAANRNIAEFYCVPTAWAYYE